MPITEKELNLYFEHMKQECKTKECETCEFECEYCITGAEVVRFMRVFREASRWIKENKK